MSEGAGAVAPDAAAAIAALLALNGDDKPFQLDSTGTDAEPCVSARWKVWDVRWKTLLSRGADRLDYQVDVRLDPAAGHYRLVEGVARETSALQVTPIDVHAEKSWSKFRGRTAGMQSHQFVLAGKTKSTDGTGQEQEGSLWTGSFRAADLKGPMVETLRGLGWRPPRDSRWARLWER
jgi:hypothetical protein